MVFFVVILTGFVYFGAPGVLGGAAITNLPNTIEVPENFEGTVYVVYSDSPTTFTVANTATCKLQLDTDCSASGTTCTLKYDSSNTPDYEDTSLTGTPKQESCEVTAVTSSNKGTLTITVLNEDDEAPDVTCTPDAGTIDENDDTVAGTLISTCTNSINIADFPVKFELSVNPGSEAGRFTINENNGEVRYSTAPLGFNYEVENSITLTVISYTPNQKAAAGSDITITVTDVNEEPVITNLPQIVYIEEFYPRYTTSPAIVDTDLVTLTVYDQDDEDGGTAQTHTGVLKDNSCAGTDDWFKFVASTASNTLKLSTEAANAKFDYESTCREFLLSIVVEDSGTPTTTSQTATLTIKVLDIQETPWFNEYDDDSLITTAYESSFNYPDQTPANSRFPISESKAIGLFKNVQSIPSPAAKSDGVYIADLNDYTRARQYYDPDCSPALDGVTGLPACVATFQFKNQVGTFMEPYFDIRQDAATGNYYLYLVNDIDYEALCKAQTWTSNTHNFEMELVGVDNSGLETTNTVTLSLQLQDANEYIPTMNPEFSFTVDENAVFDTVIGDMTCQDVNDCYNDDIDRYNINAASPASNDGSYYFKVSQLNTNTGRLQVLRPPDYETIQQVVFDVRCIDKNSGVGDEMTATATVTVNIIDLNDNEPELQQTFFSLATRYDTDYRSYLATLSATDRDSGVNAEMIYALGSFSDEFGIDSDTGEIFTKGLQLYPFTTYLIYGVVFDNGVPQNIGKQVATIRVDTFDVSAVLVDLYMGIDYPSFDKDKLIAALEDLLFPYKFFVYEVNGYVLRENVVTNGVKVSVYAIESDITLQESGLNQTKVFVRTEELLATFRESADGTPSEFFQSEQILSFSVRHVEATPIRNKFFVEEQPAPESWMVDTPEGNVVLSLILLLTLMVLIGIVFAFYTFMRRLDCYRPSADKVSYFPSQQENKLNVGKTNKSSLAALAREDRKMTAAPTLDGPPDPPVKPQLQPVIPAHSPVVQTKEGGRKIWEIRKSRDQNSSEVPMD